MCMTRNGVVYNLKKSPYIVEENNIKFYFSSKNHMDKFKENLNDNRNTLAYSLYNRFKLYPIINEMYDIILYGKIETRGFLISIEGEEYVCQKSIILSGVKKIEKR